MIKHEQEAIPEIKSQSEESIDGIHLEDVQIVQARDQILKEDPNSILESE